MLCRGFKQLSLNASLGSERKPYKQNREPYGLSEPTVRIPARNVRKADNLVRATHQSK